MRESTWITYNTSLRDNRVTQSLFGAGFYLGVSTLVATNTSFLNNVFDNNGQRGLEDVVCVQSSVNAYNTTPVFPKVVCLQQCDYLVVHNQEQSHVCHQRENHSRLIPQEFFDDLFKKLDSPKEVKMSK